MMKNFLRKWLGINALQKELEQLENTQRDEKYLSDSDKWSMLRTWQQQINLVHEKIDKIKGHTKLESIDEMIARLNELRD